MLMCPPNASSIRVQDRVICCPQKIHDILVRCPKSLHQVPQLGSVMSKVPQKSLNRVALYRGSGTLLYPILV